MFFGRTPHILLVRMTYTNVCSSSLGELPILWHCWDTLLFGVPSEDSFHILLFKVTHPNVCSSTMEGLPYHKTKLQEPYLWTLEPKLAISICKFICLNHWLSVVARSTLVQLCSCVEPSLAFATGATSKHQMVMWPGLWRKLTGSLYIVVWHMRVSTHLLEVTRLECGPEGTKSKESVIYAWLGMLVTSCSIIFNAAILP